MRLDDKHNFLCGGFSEAPVSSIHSYDFSSSYPAMGIEVDDAPDLSNDWYLHWYKMPLGVLKSNLKKDGIRFEVLISMKNDEKLVESQIGCFYFRKGGKGNSWLCYKYLD